VCLTVLWNLLASDGLRYIQRIAEKPVYTDLLSSNSTGCRLIVMFFNELYIYSFSTLCQHSFSSCRVSGRFCKVFYCYFCFVRSYCHSGGTHYLHVSDESPQLCFIYLFIYLFYSFFILNLAWLSITWELCVVINFWQSHARQHPSYCGVNTGRYEQVFHWGAFASQCLGTKDSSWVRRWIRWWLHSSLRGIVKDKAVGCRYKTNAEFRAAIIDAFAYWTP
jgi:hypothetical protein